MQYLTLGSYQYSSPPIFQLPCSTSTLCLPPLCQFYISHTCLIHVQHLLGYPIPILPVLNEYITAISQYLSLHFLQAQVWQMKRHNAYISILCYHLVQASSWVGSMCHHVDALNVRAPVDMILFFALHIFKCMWYQTWICSYAFNCN